MCCKFVTIFLAVMTAIVLSIVGYFGVIYYYQEGVSLPGVKEPMIIAHRGASYFAPEETMFSYEKAIAQKDRYLEGDVQRTKDGVLVLFHDDNLTRTTDVETVFPKRAGEGIGAFTYAELQQLSAGAWFNKAYPKRAHASFESAKILSLQDFLERVKKEEDTWIYLETKSPERYPGIEKELIALLEKTGWLDHSEKILLQSFDTKSLARLKVLAPNIRRVFLIDQAMSQKEGWSTLLARAKSVADGIGPVGYIAMPWNLLEAHQEELFVHVYTIDISWQMKLLRLFGADGFFSNRAALLSNAI